VQEQENVKNGMNNIFLCMIQKELIDWIVQPMAMTFNKNPKLHKNQDFIVFASSFIEVSSSSTMVGFSNKIINMSIFGNNQQCHTQRHTQILIKGTNSIQLVFLQCKAIVSNSKLVMFYKVTHRLVVQPRGLAMLKHCLCHLIQLSNLLQTMSSDK
jgi:hypothetical protein